MLPLSAADAISPAIQRTRTFLFRPFRFGTYLKLCLVALLTEGLGGNGGNFNFPGGGHTPHHQSSFISPFHLTPLWMGVLATAVVFGIALGILLFYLVTRLRFAYFHCLANNIREIRPGWHRYRDPANRFFLLNLAVALGFLVLLVSVALPFVAGFWRLYRQSQAGSRPDLGAILALVLPLIPIVLLLVLLAIAADIILRDFMLPHFALEDASAGEAWSAVWARIRTQIGSFLLYGLLRVLLPIVAMIALFIVLIIPAILFIAAVALFEVAVHALFTGGSGFAVFAEIFIQVLIGLFAFLIATLVGICIGGPISTAIREYALLFYGGRYRPLGDILSPPPPMAPAAPVAPEMA